MPTTATSYQLHFKDRGAKEFSQYASDKSLEKIRGLQTKFKHFKGYKTRIIRVDVTFTEVE
jgi:hypothetical protein